MFSSAAVISIRSVNGMNALPIFDCVFYIGIHFPAKTGYILVSSAQLKCKNVFICAGNVLAEEYGVLSSNCPGNGKHRSGALEAARSKSMSQGCQHR